MRRDRAADPDPDGVALAAATAAGVLLGAQLGPRPPWVPAATCLTALAFAATCLATTPSPRPHQHPPRSPQPRARMRRLPLGRPPGLARVPGGMRRLPLGQGSVEPPVRDTVRRLPLGRPPGLAAAVRPGTGPGGRGGPAGMLVLMTLVAAGAAVAGVRAAAIRGGVLPALAGRPGVVEVAATVAEEPHQLARGGRWVVLSVERVSAAGGAWRTRERAGSALPASAGRLGVGDRLWLRAGVGRARWADRLGHRPAVVLTHPLVQARAPPSSPVLRASEAVREAARRRALASLPPDRAGLLVGMALGDTSLLPSDLEQAFRAAGLTHLMAVSGANLAVVLAVGLWLAGALGLERPTLAAAGVTVVVLLVVLTRWEPSVLRAGVMATLVLLGVATGRGPGGRRALCLAVVLLLLADPGLASALGFRLSVAATAGVLWLGPLASRLLPGRIPERARTAAGVTLGAQAAALPALALALGRLSLAALPANLAGISLAGGPMLLGVVAATTAPLAPPAATLACRLADPFLIGLVAVARWAARLPGASITLTGPARAAPALVALALVFAAARRRVR